MPKMNIEYVGELRTSALHVPSGNALITDAPTDNHGKGEAFSPTDLLCTSLASCMLTIMAIKANSMNIELKGIKLKVEKVMTAAPRRVGEITLTFDWNGLDQKISAEQMESLKRSGLSCPVMLSLSEEVKKTINW